MKNLITITLFNLLVTSTSAQTILRKIDIVSQEQFTVWVYDSLDTTNEWRYHSSNEIKDVVFNLWEYYGEIERFWVNPHATFEFLFTTCSDTTYVIIHGNKEKTIIKNRQLVLDGRTKVYGKPDQKSNYYTNLKN